MTRSSLVALAAAFLFFILGCKPAVKQEQVTYFAYTQEEMDIILTNYVDSIVPIGEPQVIETQVVVDSARKIVLHEVLTTRNFKFTVPLDDKGQLIRDPKEAASRKKNDSPGTGTVTCRLRCSGIGCTWSGCNTYPCSGGKCANGCTFLDCKQLKSGMGTRGIFIL